MKKKKNNMKEPPFHCHPKVNETHIKMYGLKYSIDLKVSSCNHIIALKGKTYPFLFHFSATMIRVRSAQKEKYQILL